MADSMSPRSMALPLTHLVAGAVMALLSLVAAVVVAVLAVARLMGGLWIHDRFGAGAPSWAGGCACSGPACVHDA
ncbi:hypothetical protein [Terrabacter sp. BE26]|uniref:hypothetical protein n=1 Tax=Terrabacter sp. BE26 TaxID=2898152 RepID=UPI0035BE798A